MAKTLAVAGAGTMGAGIAQVAAQAGWEVRIFDPVDGSAEQALVSIRESLERRVDKGKMTDSEKGQILGRFYIAKKLSEALQGSDLFIEAAVEDLAVKRDIFREAFTHAPDEAILATNTSSLSVTAISAATPVPERIVGMHFFNPAPAMKLVEIVKGDLTSDGTVEAVAEIAADWGKSTAIARDTPGFIVNRVARGYYGEALRLLGEGAASHETIDRIMKNVGGFRMGPFELMDLVGIDVNFAVTQSVYHAYFEEERFRPHFIQQKMVDAGLLGRKTKRGFYHYGA